MRLSRLLSLVVLALLSFTLLPIATSAQGNSEAAHLCQKGGWETLQGSDGTVFANQDECVSHAAMGGLLVSVPRVVADLSIVFEITRETGGLLTFSGSGLLPGSEILLDVHGYTGGWSDLIGSVQGTANADGAFSLTQNFACNYFTSITLRGIAVDGTPVSESAASPC